jgi:thymidine kinase
MRPVLVGWVLKACEVGRIGIVIQIYDPAQEVMAGRTGTLIVITGSMFSGKTEELIRRVRRAIYARRSVQVFKHAIDTRSGRTEIRSHNGVPHEAIAVSTSEELLEKVEETMDVVAVEEAQFFDEGIVEACRSLADAGYEVAATGLDMDFRGTPFGPMPRLLAEADEVVKLRAICARCGRDASRSQRLINGRPAPVSAPIILVGAEESYEARCRHCHEVPEGVFQYGLPGL